jgi:hypothetical protein
VPSDVSVRVAEVLREMQRTTALLETVGGEIEQWDGDQPSSTHLVEVIETVEAALTRIEVALKALRPAS